MDAGAEPILDVVDAVIASRRDGFEAIAALAGGAVLEEAGSTEYFEVRAGEVPAPSPFARIEVRLAKAPPRDRGLVILELRPGCPVDVAAVAARHGTHDGLEVPLAGGPTGRPVYHRYLRPWGKLAFGFVDAGDGDGLASVTIDWTGPGT